MSTSKISSSNLFLYHRLRIFKTQASKNYSKYKTAFNDALIEKYGGRGKTEKEAGFNRVEQNIVAEQMGNSQRGAEAILREMSQGLLTAPLGAIKCQ
jgi:hypothetical protein